MGYKLYAVAALFVLTLATLTIGATCDAPQAPVETSVHVPTPTATSLQQALPLKTTAPLIIPPTHTSPPAPKGPGIASGGLGLTKEAWERLEGPPTMYGNTPWYGGNHYNVLFSDTGYLYILITQYPQKAVGLSVARAESLTLIPKDSIELRHFQQPDSSGDPVYIVYDYKSKSLANALGPSSDLWFGAKPGSFRVSFSQYQADGGRVSDFAIGTGNQDP